MYSVEKTKSMRDSEPLISVLIPSYNHEAYIEKAIRSIWEQTYRNIEIIVVDDLSSDRSLELLEKLRDESPFPMDVLVNESRLGPARTFNKAISRAQGDLVAMTASDDFFAPDRFEWQVDKFVRDPDLLIHYANGYVYKDGQTTGVVHKEKTARLLSKTSDQILEDIYVNNIPLFIQTALVRKELLDAVGGFDGEVLADDWVINVRFFRYLSQTGGRFAYDDKPVFYYRKHGENVYKNFHRQSQLKLEFIERYTPKNLKKQAVSNIVFALGVSALKHREFKEAFRFWRMSQKARFSFRQNLRFFRKFISACVKPG